MFRKKLAFTIIVLFWLGCLSQVALGNREDYPFTFFGMYRGTALGKNYISEVTLQIPNHEPMDFYNCIDDHRYILRNRLLKILLKHERSLSKDTLSRLDPLSEDSLHIDELGTQKILSIFLKIAQSIGTCSFPENSRLIVSISGWEHISIENHLKPDYKKTVYNFEVHSLLEVESFKE